MAKKGHYLKMRYSSDLLFAGNEYHRCLWRAVGGQRWTTLTSILVVIRDPSDQNAVTHQLSEHSIPHPLCNMGREYYLFFQSINQSMIQSINYSISRSHHIYWPSGNSYKVVLCISTSPDENCSIPPFSSVTTSLKSGQGISHFDKLWSLNGSS